MGSLVSEPHPRVVTGRITRFVTSAPLSSGRGLEGYERLELSRAVDKRKTCAASVRSGFQIAHDRRAKDRIRAGAAHDERLLTTALSSEAAVGAVARRVCGFLRGEALRSSSEDPRARSTRSTFEAPPCRLGMKRRAGFSICRTTRQHSTQVFAQ